MNNNKQNNIIFAITIEELQDVTIRVIGKKLTDEELYTARKGIEAGLSFDIETVLRTAIEEAVKK
ncbi:MAG: hypothetical protein N2247_09730 [Leptospiraceae bacterium]|nr:hypothetical protein [Leptospiraceae bacterium]